jgi:hypothetical protein
MREASLPKLIGGERQILYRYILWLRIDPWFVVYL